MSFTTQLPTTQEYVYVIHAKGTNRIKLGFTTKPQERLANLQTASPFPLQMLACWPGSRAREDRLHRYMAQFRQVGEWFEVPPFVGLKLWELVHKGEVTRPQSNPKQQSGCVRLRKGRPKENKVIVCPLNVEVKKASGGFSVYRYWRERDEQKGRSVKRSKYSGFITTAEMERLQKLSLTEQHAAIEQVILSYKPKRERITGTTEAE